MAKPNAEEIATVYLVAADDGTIFRCWLDEIGRDRQWRWRFACLDGREYVGPPWYRVSRLELGDLVNEWWAEAKRFNNGETVEQMRARFYQDMARDN